jgi:hypothetical protein
MSSVDGGLVLGERRSLRSVTKWVVGRGPITFMPVEDFQRLKWVEGVRELRILVLELRRGESWNKKLDLVEVLGRAGAVRPKQLATNIARHMDGELGEAWGTRLLRSELSHPEPSLGTLIAEDNARRAGGI